MSETPKPEEPKPQEPKKGWLSRWRSKSETANAVPEPEAIVEAPAPASPAALEPIEEVEP